uniref:DNA replication licensing factor MCM7 n=1 Tax=Arcella intermedia TaxID=1963864 RepID=A0A6B2KZ17_9EUKA
MLLKKIANHSQTILPIHLDDMVEYFGNHELSQAITTNTLRYLNLFCDAIDENLPVSERGVDLSDVLEVLEMHRANASAVKAPPKELSRRYELRFVPLKESMSAPIPLRMVRSKHVGNLVTVSGIVIRVSEVKPLMMVASYFCDQCNSETFQKVNSKQFMPITKCPSPDCTKQKSIGRLELQTRGSKFVKFQEIRIQELPDQVPTGHIPRSLSVHLFGELTRKLSPGDTATIHGIFLPVPNEGYRAKYAGLIASTYIYALGVEPHKRKYSDFVPSESTMQELEHFIHTSANPYNKLAQSIAPEIYGHEDIKKALLLMMVGGVTRVMADGMKIRGDINICLMGDPGVAKSQLLKHISIIAPRGVYTSGKGASGVGLTAAVLKDPISKELVLEGGSLVLADMGICCIDEFDKMEENDRTAIHEVMEQQTISIAKAGITTTLNARTSILAAANPSYGRYNLRKTPMENINLPAALLSRFDLLFILLDIPDPARDRALAEHVTHVHRFSKPPTSADRGELTSELMRSFIAQAKTYEPFIPPHLSEFIVDTYVSMRQKDYGSNTEETLTTSFGYTTARSLLGILRLSQAMARVRFADQVVQSDVEEAIRLMQSCHQSLRQKLHLHETRLPRDKKTEIFHVIRSKFQQLNKTKIKYAAVLEEILRSGFTQQDLDATIRDYEGLDVIQIDAEKTKITLVRKI